MKNILLDEQLPRIGNALMECPCCGWEGTVYECEPDVDGDGSLGCPVCCTGDCNPISIVHDKHPQFDLLIRWLSNQDTIVYLSGQFLMQLKHDTHKMSGFEFTDTLRFIADKFDKLQLVGVEAAQAAKAFQSEIENPLEPYE